MIIIHVLSRLLKQDLIGQDGSVFPGVMPQAKHTAHRRIKRGSVLSTPRLDQL